MCLSLSPCDTLSMLSYKFNVLHFTVFKVIDSKSIKRLLHHSTLLLESRVPLMRLDLKSSSRYSTQTETQAITSACNQRQGWLCSSLVTDPIPVTKCLGNV